MPHNNIERMRFVLTILLMSGAMGFTQAKEIHVSVNGKDSNPGTLKLPLRTINYASGIAVPGDLITVHAGTYREMVTPVTGGTSESKRITYQAAKAERVIIKGSERVKGWKRLETGRWELELPESFFGSYNPFKDLIYGDWFFPIKPLHTGEVFINGKALEEHVSWSCRQTVGKTLIHADFGSLDPNAQETEITARPSCFYPAKTGVDYITVRGFVMSQAATQWAAPTAEQVGLLGTNWSKGWIIENNVISDSKCAGITLGKDRETGHNVWSADMSKDGADLYNEVIVRAIDQGWNKALVGSHIVRNNKIFNCGAAGICGSLGAIFSEISGNEVYHVYTRRNYYGAEMAGIKIHGAIDVKITGNKVRNCFIGLWLDWMAQGTEITGNTFEDNAYADFFPEVNHGPYTVTGNQFLSAFSLKDWSEGGIYRNNLFAGLISRAPQERKTPLFKAHSTELVSVNPIAGGGNTFTGNTFYTKSAAFPIRPKMHLWDQEDQLMGYGLDIYSHAALPVIRENNQTVPRN